MGAGYAVVVAAIVYLTAPYIVSIFTDDRAVIQSAVYILNALLPTYWLLAVFNVKTGTIRGVGKTFQTMVISVFSLCVLRILWITFVFGDSQNLLLLVINYPVTWLAGAVIATVYEKKYITKKNLAV